MVKGLSTASWLLLTENRRKSAMQVYGVGFAASLLAILEKIPVALQISPCF